MLAFGASVLAVGLRLSAPAQRVVGPAPASLTGTVAVQIPSASGSLLQAWWLPGRPDQGAVVLLHGVRGSRLALVRRAEVLHANGLGVLLFDFQAHGESPGRRITFGRLEALDAEAAVGFVRQAAPRERVGAIGLSLGAAAALLGPAPLDVDALVVEAVYPDILTALADRLRVALGPVAGPLFTPVLVPAFALLLPPVTGIRPADLRPIDHVGELSAPVLLLSGTADRHTLLTEAEAIYARAPEPKRFWAVPGAGHVDLEHFDPDQYWQHVLPFLSETLTSKHSAPEATAN